jgi:hypothetical protein
VNDHDAHNVLLHQILHAAARPPQEWDERIPVELERICLKALAKRPSDRYMSRGISFARKVKHGKGRRVARVCEANSLIIAGVGSDRSSRCEQPVLAQSIAAGQRNLGIATVLFQGRGVARGEAGRDPGDGGQEGANDLAPIRRERRHRTDCRDGDPGSWQAVLDCIAERCELTGIVARPGEVSTSPPATGLRLLRDDEEDRMGERVF